jgi:hypothetical protein
MNNVTEMSEQWITKETLGTTLLINDLDIDQHF